MSKEAKVTVIIGILGLTVAYLAWQYPKSQQLNNQSNSNISPPLLSEKNPVEKHPANMNQSPEAPPQTTSRASKIPETPLLMSPRSPSDSPTESASEGPKTDDFATQTEEKPQPNRRQPPTCNEANTGNYGFKTVTVFTVIVYYREDSDSSRIITVRPGQTQYVYDFPAGRHNYVVTYRDQVPIMTFPPGAPTMEQDVIYQRGEIYVEQCKKGVLDIK